MNAFDLALLPLGCEALALVLILALAIARPGLTARISLRRFPRLWGAIGDPRWAPLLIGALAALGLGLVAARDHFPVASVHDEFSYLLGADTFASGRLANPSHPLAEHFETFHVLAEPSRASKYPPGQSLVLALGRTLGHPALGVWISAALASTAVCWMLQAWVPTRWAFLGAFVFATHIGIYSYWAQSYWGGMLATFGGALVFGGLRRLARRPRTREALAFGAGLVILANSRPFEGLVVSAPAVAALAVALRRRRVGAWTLTRTVAVPAALVLALGAAFMVLYNARVTSSFWDFPYFAYERSYNPAPLFLFQPARPPPAYANSEMAAFYDWHLGYYEDLRSLWGWVYETGRRILVAWFFVFGAVLTLPMLALRRVRVSPWIKLAAGISLALGAIHLAAVTRFPHYLAPAIGLFLVLAIEGLRQLQPWQWRGRPLGGPLVRAVPVASVVFLVACVFGAPRDGGQDWFTRRAEIALQLGREPGQHVVIVRYADDHDFHDEWVYNRAAIDTAKVIWARDLGPERNLPLIDYYPGRQFWVIDADDPRAHIRAEVSAELTIAREYPTFE